MSIVEHLYTPADRSVSIVEHLYTPADRSVSIVEHLYTPADRSVSIVEHLYTPDDRCVSIVEHLHTSADRSVSIAEHCTYTYTINGSTYIHTVCKNACNVPPCLFAGLIRELIEVKGQNSHLSASGVMLSTAWE